MDRKERVDYFRARRGGSLLDFCDEDGGHGLLEASSVNRLHKKGILCLSIRDYLRREPDVSLFYEARNSFNSIVTQRYIVKYMSYFEYNTTCPSSQL